MANTDNLEDKKLLCVGLICLDVIHVCNSYPFEGTDQRIKKMTWQKGGNAANTSAVLGLLGNKVDFLGVFPKDTKDLFQKSACSFVRQEMERCGVGLEQMSLVGDSDLPYSSVVINDETGSRTILHCPGLLLEVSFNFFQKLDLSAYSWIHFEGRNTEEVVKMICHVVKYNEGQDEANRVKMSVELEKPHRRNLPLLLPHADLVLISQEYARDSGYNNAPDTVKAFKDHVKSSAGIVCAWGELGAASGVSGAVGDVIMTPAFSPERVLDTLGAGDTFLGALLHARLRTTNLPSIVKFACKVAGRKVGSYGYDCLRDFSQTVE